MTQTILLKRTSTPAKVPLTTDLSLGEAAVNTYDGRLFIKKNNGADSIVEFAPLASPTFTGSPTAPTAATGDNSTLVATTAFVKAQAYLTSYTETSTLQDVTGRGASSNVATITLSAVTASTTTGTGTLVVGGGVGIAGAVNIGGSAVIGGDLAVNGATSADITSSTSTATLFNATVASISIGSAATTLNLGVNTTAGTFNIASGAIASGTKVVNIGTNGTGGTTTIAIGTSTGSTTTINGAIQFPALGTSGLLRLGVGGALSADTATYLTSYTETDTLQNVTGRGASSNVATITLTGATASTTTGTGTLVVTGGVGISGAINVGGNANVGGNLVVTGDLTVNGTSTIITSTTISVNDVILTLGGQSATTDTVKDRGVETKWGGITLTMTNFIGAGTTTVTGTVASTAGYAPGDVITISGATGTEQSKLNGTWQIATVPNGTTFTFVVTTSVSAGTLTTTLGTTVKVKNAFFGVDQSTGKFVFVPQAQNNAETFSGTKGTVDANLEWADLLNKKLRRVRAATTVNIATIAGAAPNTLDGVTLVQGDQVLVKDQTTQTQNNIYQVDTVGTGANGSWSVVTDANSSDKLAGIFVSVNEGTAWGGTSFTCGAKSSDTYGSANVVWSPISSASVPIDGGVF